MSITEAWWEEANVELFDSTYKISPERKQKMKEKVPVIGVFFGSYRNRSTKHFVQFLNKLYSYTTDKQEPFEIVYVPLDEEETDCEFFVKSLMGNWLVVPWANQQFRRRLKNMYNVSEQPWLVIVKNNYKGSLVRFEGKGDLLDYGYFSCKYWTELAATIDTDEPKPEVTNYDDNFGEDEISQKKESIQEQSNSSSTDP